MFDFLYTEFIKTVWKKWKKINNNSKTRLEFVTDFLMKNQALKLFFLFKSFPFYAEINLFLNWKSPFVFVIFIDIPVFIIIKEHWFIDEVFYPNNFFNFFFLQSFPFYSEIYFLNWKFPLVIMMTINAYNNRTLLNKLIEWNLIMYM